MTNQTLEYRLAVHAESAGFGKVMTVQQTNPLAYLLVDKENQPIPTSEYMQEVLKAKKRHKKPEIKELDGIKLYYKAGVFVSPNDLQSYGLSHEDFLYYFGIDIDKGLSLVNAHVNGNEKRLFVQLHETTHARDNKLGFPHLERKTPECQAYEVLTDARSLMFGFQLLDESCFDFSKPFYEQKINSSYIGLNNSNIHVLRDFLREQDPRTDMPEILSRLQEHLNWTHGRGIQDLLLKAPAYDKQLLKENRREALTRVLDTLIKIEGQTKLPQIVPTEF